ncbi:[protein-PII] uridylyltransferase [Bartonella tamiae]|uniref:Bifunctional uridylyltransferase/uridylyl-removing enzyme n=1 Tax=Bartonella tamiae Th239 TaxID=1094558 RepID=J0ZP43_9HYPH|nr:[protein-PII] uridylyltransferase [Bartonella tamiae]EJF90343.1 protein-P-II uridylyltransferase [Bartonella tamiae Th239]EJF93716.1 protein-P-II uridylyltransferase [Bartonella tamiae Th307]
MDVSLKTLNLQDESALYQFLKNKIYRLQPTYSEDDIRAYLVTTLKKILADGRRNAEILLKKNGKGRQCAQYYSQCIDAVIKSLYRIIAHHIYPLKEKNFSPSITLIAVGGYGRGTLAPYSDIDLHFLFKDELTQWDHQFIEYFLYSFWDIGLKVGHAARTIAEEIDIAQKDISARTALLEARFLSGNQKNFETLMQRFEDDIVKGTSPAFIRAKLFERDIRHEKADKTRYLVEPNVKEGKGGQRDLQTLLWIIQYHYRVIQTDKLVTRGILSKSELRIFKKADDFLWAVRCHMHFFNKKAQERLTFDIQRDIAHRLGYTAHPGLEDVERFMKHYFWVAKQVGDLTRIVSAALEEDYAKPVPGLNQVFLTFSHEKKHIEDSPDFVIENQRINILDDEVYQRDPVNLIRLFYLSDTLGLDCHPHAVQEASRALNLITPTIREDKKANRLFLDILTSPRDPSLILRRMNESGVLGKFIPEFGKIVAMMQFNMYHHYTVDEHLLRCISFLSEIDRGEVYDDHPIASSILPTFKKERTVLYCALFLHDIAKGRPESHSIVGARIARKLCPRFGLSRRDTETVAWLIENHLIMNRIAQSRDLNDRKTIEDFAKIVQTMDQLKLLFILTICDIKGVGKGVWNGWKGLLLRTLYDETALVLTGGFSQISSFDRIHLTQKQLRDRLSQWDEKDYQNYLALHYNNYWLTVPLEDQIRHAHFFKRTALEKTSLSIMMTPRASEDVTEITLLAPDHPRLLSIITGACAAAGANIVDAQIFTTSDGRALDIILIKRAFDFDEDETKRARRVKEIIEQALKGTIRLPDEIARHAPPKRTRKIFDVTPTVEINNDLSETFSVIEVKSMDRPGLLSDLTKTLSDLSLDIASAHITTFGEKAIDSFYVRDLIGHKLTNPQRQTRICHKLLSIVQTQTADIVKKS